jgi:hypothetical protein
MRRHFPDILFERYADVYHRFTEGFETADLKAAESILEGFRSDGVPDAMA